MPSIAALLSCAGSDIARDQVAKSRIPPLQVVIAVLLSKLNRLQFAGANRFGVFFFLGNPDAAIVAQGLGHQGQLGLKMPANRNAGGVNLREAWIGHESPFAVSLPSGRYVRAHSVGAQVKDVAIATGAKQYGMGGVALKFS